MLKRFTVTSSLIETFVLLIVIVIVFLFFQLSCHCISFEIFKLFILFDMCFLLLLYWIS